MRVAPYCVGCNAAHTRRCDQQQRINHAKTVFGMASLFVAMVLLGLAIGVQL